MQKIKQKIKKWILWYSYTFFKNNYKSKIFFYHDVFDRTQYTFMGTPLSMFQKHIQVFQENGFRIVDEIQNPTNEVLICFDDGFHGIYDTKDFFIKNNIKPLVFIAVDLIGKENYLSKEEILELQSYGFQFECHTWSHNDLTKFNNIELEHELLDSKRYLTELLGKEKNSICFPMGYFSEKVTKESLHYGYEKLYTSLPGNYYDDIGEKLFTRNLVQFSSSKEVKYRLLGNSSVLFKKALKQYFKL
jgi:peptidoglycan/xylan/chitin deacetylase (PgdA/CDA1 family)